MFWIFYFNILHDLKPITNFPNHFQALSPFWSPKPSFATAHVTSSINAKHSQDLDSYAHQVESSMHFPLNQRTIIWFKRLNLLNSTSAVGSQLLAVAWVCKPKQWIHLTYLPARYSHILTNSIRNYFQSLW